MTGRSLLYLALFLALILSACASGSTIEAPQEAIAFSDPSFLALDSAPVLAMPFSGSQNESDFAEYMELEQKHVGSNHPKLYRIKRLFDFDEEFPSNYESYQLDLLIMGWDGVLKNGDENLSIFEDPWVTHDIVYHISQFIDGLLREQEFYYHPFNYYITDISYGNQTPNGIGRDCDGLILPDGIIPSGNMHVDNPGWTCNLALSTVRGVSLNLGLILHNDDGVQNASRFNLFSGNINKSDTILHELSHAAFAMSDESSGARGRFSPKKHPNVYMKDNSCGGGDICNNACSQIVGTDYFRCVPEDDTTNLMHFEAPNWNNLRYYFASKERLKHIYGICRQGGC